MTGRNGDGKFLVVGRERENRGPKVTLNDKKVFIHDLVNSIHASLQEDVATVPEEWDGHELRQWIADRFSSRATLGSLMKRGTKRRIDYENEILIRNL